MSTVSRTQQRAFSEAAILDAAISAYGAAGPNGASLRDVATAAGVTHPLIAQYYESKEGLLAAVGDRLTSKVAATVDAVDCWDADGFLHLVRTAREHRSMTKLLIRTALGDLEPDGFPACLGDRWPSPDVGPDDGSDGGSDDRTDRRARICQYAASSLVLGWLSLDSFMTSAVRLGNVSERRRDEAIAAAAAHVWSLAAEERPPLQPGRPIGGDVLDSSSGERSTRDTLLASAIELFAASGPAAVSIRDVARHAGVNHGLLHRHFGSKDDLITEAIEVGVASLMPGALAPQGFDVDRVVDVMHRDPVPARLIARTLVDDIPIGSVRLHFPLMRGLLSLAERVPADERPSVVADPRLAAVAAASMVGGSVLWGPALRAASGYDDDVRSVLADLSHHLLGSTPTGPDRS